MYFSNLFVFQRIGFVVLLCFPFILGAMGCTTPHAKPEYTVGQLYDVSQQKLITFDELQTHLLTTDVIYIGEEHYTPSHLAAAQTVMESLLAHERHPTLAMEMFSWDGQPGLDRFLREANVPVEQLVEEALWEKNWGGKFSDYEPLVTFAQSHQIDILALNPPRPLVRLVASKGLEEAMHDPQMGTWPLKHLVHDDPEYEQLIFKQIEACHPKLPDHVYRRIFEASIFRDEGMAQIITNNKNKKPAHTEPLVSYTGGGHIQYQIPIPKRVNRQSPNLTSLSIYLIAWHPEKEQEVRSALKEGIADYIWLTDLGPNGLQARCGE